tara:strand:- start:1096 stop:1569 length:474 start_codon:yes stop_codon:yes gene_type:complete
MGLLKKKEKKKFKDTKVGQFLLKKIPNAIVGIADVLPDAGVLGLVKGIVAKDKDLSEEDREMANKLLDMDILEMQQITARLKSDNEHIVTRLVRPVAYGAMFMLFMFVVLLDGNLGEFQIKAQYIPVIQSLFGTMTMFYFGSRGAEKIAKIIQTYRD